MTRLLFALGVALCVTVPAAAQVVRPPKPATPEKPPTVIYYVIGVLLAGATIGISVMPSKRGHHD